MMDGRTDVTAEIVILIELLDEDTFKVEKIKVYMYKDHFFKNKLEKIYISSR